MNNIYYIYTLIDPIDKKIKYVGKTKDLKDRLQRHMSPVNLKELWTSKNKWLLYLKNQKLKPIMEVIDEGDSENIDDLEKYWISQFKQWGFKLKNETEGGDGYNWTGRKHKEESKLKLKMNNPNRKIICQYEIGTDELINEYNSAREAERETGTYRRHLIKCCRGEQSFNKINGYYWRFKDDYFPYVENKTSAIRVEQYDKNQNLIREFKTVRECKKFGFQPDRIDIAIKENRTYKNYYWKKINQIT